MSPPRTWPSREFTALMAIIRENDTQRQGWLSDSGMVLQEEWPLPKGRTAQIYTRADP